jgi:hypothetical protein
MSVPKPNSRYLCSEPVFIARADHRGDGGRGRHSPAILGNLEEIGEWFAEVLTDCAFPRNAAVRIVTKARQLEGVVEDCERHRQLGFFVKIRLSPQSRWSESWFTPQHLLKLWSGTHTNDQSKVSPLKAASGY